MKPLNTETYSEKREERPSKSAVYLYSEKNIDIQPILKKEPITSNFVQTNSKYEIQK